mmetsp:Transcript_49926/g.79724  ORF Transcript_49926/g.79724 Transcript_49926/m.79724 type:complete len:220 (+) Transcript_49926:637-1296(+)
MASQIADHFAGVGLVDLDGVGVHGRKELAAMAEAHLSASLDGDLLVGPEVLHEEIHQPQLIGKAHDQMEAAGVEGYGEGFLVEDLAQFLRPIHEIPDSHRLVGAAGHHQWFSDTNVQAKDGPRVEGRQGVLHVALFGFQEIRWAQRKRQQLITAGGNGHCFLCWAHSHGRDSTDTGHGPGHGAIQLHLLGLAEHLLGIITSLVKGDHALLAACDEATAK